jgi:acetylornithine deacetylase
MVMRGTAAEGDPVALAAALVAVESINPTLAPGGSGEAKIASLCASWLEGWGMSAKVDEVAPGRCNVVAVLDGEGPTLLLNGHLDTVGIEGMTVPPFAAERSGHRLVGRGSCDMKGGVAALLAATARLARGGPRPNLIVGLTADEEHASLGMDALVRSGLRADMAVVCEPTDLAVMPAHKGFVWIRAAFQGRAAHGSRPELGVDAVRHAGLYLAGLDSYAAKLRDRPAHPLLGYGSFHAGTIDGGSAESVYPERCDLLLERRTMPGESTVTVVREFQDVLDRLAALEPTVSATLQMTLDRPGTEVPEGSRLVQGLLAAGEGLSLPRKVEGMTAWVDAAFLNEAGIPAVCYGPGDIAQAHSADEWIDTRQIDLCADVLERFARGLVT